MASPTSTQFAVAAHVLTYLAVEGRESPDRPVSSAELAASTRVTPVHVRRVLGPLRDAGLVESRAGQQGGWLLAIAPERIRLVEIYDLLRADEPLVGIHGPNPACPVGRGVQVSLEVLDERLTDGVRSHLAGVTVADLLVSSGLGSSEQGIPAR